LTRERDFEDTEAQGSIAHGLFAIAEAIDRLGTQVKYLGNGDAATTMGAIEAYGLHIGEIVNAQGAAIAEALHAIAEKE
jgi:hypothetical protein